MNKTKLLYLICSLFLILPTIETSAAEESDFSVVAGGAINYKTLEFNITGETFKPQLVTFDLSFTGVYKSFYATINYDKSIQDDYVYNYDFATQDDAVMQISREDSGLTLGYSFANSLSVFGGYLDGVTTVLIPGNYGAIQDPNPLNHEPERFNGVFDFAMAGPFIGVGYAVPLGQKATLSLNIAYANMDGELLFDLGPAVEKIDGDTTGFSYGISVSGPLADSMAYRIGIKANRYKFEDKDFIPGVTSDDFTHDQNYSIFYVGVSNYF